MLVFRSLAVVAVVFVAGPVFADDKKNEADLKALVGKWKLAKGIVSGQDVTGFIDKMKFEIRDGGKFAIELGAEKYDGTLTVDAAKDPKEMDLKPAGGFHKGRTLRALYKLDGDTLVICYNYDLANEKRMEAFESKNGTTTLIQTYTREKK